MMGELARLSYGSIKGSDLRAFHRVLENMGLKHEARPAFSGVLIRFGSPFS